jgi:hypothetical protein
MSTNRSGAAVGFTYFAAIMMIVMGAMDVLQGISAIAKEHYYVVGSQYLWKLNVASWGWINLVIGAVVLLAGIALLGGATWARVVGIIVAAVVAVSNFMWLPYYPIGSIIVIALSVAVIWALAAHGREIADT